MKNDCFGMSWMLGKRKEGNRNKMRNTSVISSERYGQEEREVQGNR